MKNYSDCDTYINTFKFCGKWFEKVVAPDGKVIVDCTAYVTCGIYNAVYTNCGDITLNTARLVRKSFKYEYGERRKDTVG